MRRIGFRLQLFRRESERRYSEEVLGVLLHALSAANVAYLREHPATPPLYQAGVRYRAEPFPREEWRGVAEVLRERHGDCEDLACWRVAELRRRGVQAEPIFRHRQVGRLSVYHILVRLPDGSVEDPSALLGMNEGGVTAAELGVPGRRRGARAPAGLLPRARRDGV